MRTFGYYIAILYIELFAVGTPVIDSPGTDVASSVSTGKNCLVFIFTLVSVLYRCELLQCKS